MKAISTLLLLALLSGVMLAGWTVQNTINLHGVHFVNSSVGFAVGSSGTILKTSNGGIAWITQQSGTTRFLTSVFAVDANTAFVVGHAGTILKTTNGGGTWTQQTSGTTSDLQEVQFLNGSLGFAISGNSDVFIKTTNGGTAWTPMGPGTGWWLKSICFIDSNSGWLCGDGPTIMKTTNGGTTWTSQSHNFPSNTTLFRIFFLNSSLGWVVGGNYNGTGGDPVNIIAKTTNGGSTWSRMERPDTVNHLTSVFFSDPNNGWAVGFRGTILKSTNGGTTWIVQSSGSCNIINDVHFTSQSIGWAVADGMLILSTVDGGGPTSVDGTSAVLPASHGLEQNYPNPFNPVTTFRFSIAKNEWATLKVYDLLGREITTLVDEMKQPGVYTVEWNASKMASGVYFYTLKAGEFEETKKLVLLR